MYSGVQQRGGGLEEAWGAAWGWHAMMGAVYTRGGGVEAAALGRCGGAGSPAAWGRCGGGEGATSGLRRGGIQRRGGSYAAHGRR